MNDSNEISPKGAEIIAALTEVRDALKGGERIEDLYTVRTLMATYPRPGDGPFVPDLNNVHDAVAITAVMIQGELVPVHLSRSMAEELWPKIKRFAETGHFEEGDDRRGCRYVEIRPRSKDDRTTWREGCNDGRADGRNAPVLE